MQSKRRTPGRSGQRVLQIECDLPRCPAINAVSSALSMMTPRSDRTIQVSACERIGKVREGAAMAEGC